MSENIVDTFNDPADFTIGGVASNPTVTSYTTHLDTITFILSHGIHITDNPTLAFAVVGSGDVEDVLANNLVAFTGQAVTNDVPVLGTPCYDCKPPKVEESQVTIGSDTYVASYGDELTHITANVGDEVTLLLKITDNRTVETIPFIGVYTNFMKTPSDMSLFYSNHYDRSKNISASFSEWNIRSDNVAYDYNGNVSWTNSVPTLEDDPKIGTVLQKQFTMKFSESMETSKIIVKSSDYAGNYSYEVLPVTLEVIGGDAPIDFEPKKNQVVLGFFDETVLSMMISELNTSDNISTPISALFGISDDSLPVWTSDLAMWTAQGKLSSGDLIVAAEYLINQ